MSETVSVPSRSPTFPEVLKLALRGGMSEVHTNMPGRVESYDAARQLVDVQPLVMQQVLEEDGTTTAIAYPVIRNVPLIVPGANGFRCTFPVANGDEVSISFCECSLEIWKANGGLVDPKDARRFHISDATATLGLHSNKTPWTGASTTAMTVGKDAGPQAVFRTTTIEIGADAASPATDKAVLGSTRKIAEDAHLQAVATALTSAQAALSAAGIAVSAAGAGMTAPPLTPVGTILATLGTQLSLAAAQLGAASTSFTSFKSQQASLLSQIVNLK